MTDEPSGRSRNRCSMLNETEPAWGTALQDRRLLIVEQPGAWGRDAPQALDPAIAEAYPGWRLLVARHPTRLRLRGPRRWWTLETADSAIIARQGVSVGVPSLSDSLDESGRCVFVCTNGRRDPCCAEFGRALLRGRIGPALWEISHLGGHRFAPTGLLWPGGLMLGRLTSDVLDRILTGAPPALASARGRIGRSPAEQVAEIAVAQREGLPLGLLVSRSLDQGTVLVSFLETEDARAGRDRSPLRGRGNTDWVVVLNRVELPERPLSCGRAPEPCTSWTVRSLNEGGLWTRGPTRTPFPKPP